MNYDKFQLLQASGIKKRVCIITMHTLSIFKIKLAYYLQRGSPTLLSINVWFVIVKSPVDGSANPGSKLK